MCAIMVVWQLMFPRDSLSSMVSLLSLNKTSRNPSLAKKKGLKNPRGAQNPFITRRNSWAQKRNKKDLWFHINEAGFEPHTTSCDLLAEIERNGREILSLKRRANLDKLQPKLLLTTTTTDESPLARHANNLQWITPGVFPSNIRFKHFEKCMCELCESEHWLLLISSIHQSQNRKLFQFSQGTIHQTHDLIQFNLWFKCFSLINS